MFAITVAEKGGEQRRLDFDKAEITIGRVQGNDVILPKGNVSKRHARIVLKDGKFIIVDLKSTNGTYVNGRKITSPLVVKETDKIYIGDFILGVDEGAEGAEAAGAPPPAAVSPEPAAAPPSEPAPRPAPSPSIPPPGSPQRAASAPPTAPPMQASPTVPPPSAAPPPQAAPAGLAMNVPSAAPEVPPPASRMPTTTKPGELAADSLRAEAAGSEPSSPAPSQAAHIPEVASKPQPETPRMQSATVPPVGAQPGTVMPAVGLGLQSAILEEVWPKLELGKVPLHQLGDEGVWQRTEKAIRDVVTRMAGAGQIPGDVAQEQLVRNSLNEALGFGVLEELLADGAVEEIVVESAQRIFASRGGVMTETGLAFSSESSFGRTVGRLVAQSGQRIDQNTPFVESQLRDGSRVLVAIPPVAVRGACLTIRRPSKKNTTIGELISSGCISQGIADFLSVCVKSRRNVLVCGSSQNGKVSLLAALANAVPQGERIVSVEDVAELNLQHPGWISFESRSVGTSNASAVTLRSVLRGAVRMRPDRLLVGGVRGDEALELVMAMGSANDGTMATVGGENSTAALAKLASLASLGAPGSSSESLVQAVGSAVDVVVQVATFADGVTRVMAVEEVVGGTNGVFQTQQLFVFAGGRFAAQGVIPSFYKALSARGETVDSSIFQS